ncbi:MAG TPA: YbgC/FadM family acyl-CoA thioesterase [Hyphomicrobiales bacterium]|nr:YbgC/FadM family acyl-CoA thioesterase [Kaistiaceae bacterium]HQF30478.1 YbgC/FadM family acyl-CoA thioesterase [Hyphomicrobiales bacterium]
MTTRGAWPDIAGRIEDGRHLLAVRVYFEDTDFSGVVYHANYLRFMERGRSDYLRLLGIHHSALDAGAEGEALAFAIIHMELDFLKPARIDDVLEVVTHFAGAVTGVRFEVEQEVRRGSDVLVRARGTAVVINREGRPRRLPATLRALLEKGAGREPAGGPAAIP